MGNRMQVNNVHPQINYIQSASAKPKAKPDEKIDIQKPAGDFDDKEVLETNVLIEDNQGGSENQKGVVRLLQEGHFKGVADVRLRINHFQELSAIEDNQLKLFAAENTDNVSTSITETISGFLGNDGQELAIQGEYDAIKELEQIFLQDVNSAKEAFLASEKPSITLFEDDLNNAFQSLIQSLDSLNTTVQTPTDMEESIESALQTQTGSESPIEQPVQPEAPGTDFLSDTGNQPGPIVTEDMANPDPVTIIEPESGFQAFIEDLSSSFREALDTLMNDMKQSSVLPELSEPEGNGRAYDKFLQIYNQMHGISSTDHISEESTLLDSLA